MEDKMQKLLNGLEYKDLIQLQRDLKSGALLLQHIVNRKIIEVENEHRNVCASCGKKINTELDDVYTMLFGDKTLRKKATFCGLDCLHDFTSEIQDQKQQQFRRELRGEHGNF